MSNTVFLTNEEILESFERLTKSCNNSANRIEAFTQFSKSLKKLIDENPNDIEVLKNLTNELVAEELFIGLGKNIGLKKYKIAGKKIKKVCQISSYLLGNDSDFECISPVESTGDGNCLFNAVSILLYGS